MPSLSPEKRTKEVAEVRQLIHSSHHFPEEWPPPPMKSL